MECRAYAICMDSQSGGHLGQDRKVPSKAGGNLSRMHKTEKTAKESRMNYMYSHLCDTTLAFHENLGCRCDSRALQTHTPPSTKSLPRTFSHERLSGRQQAHPLPTRSSMSPTEITSVGSISG